METTRSTATLEPPVASLPPITLNFPQGLPVAPEHQSWLLVDEHPCGRPYFWLRSATNPNLQGAVVATRAVVPDYAPQIAGNDVRSLELTGAHEVEVLSSVFFGEEGYRSVNLRNPIVVNTRTGRAKLVGVLNAATYPESATIAGAPPKPKTYWTCKERNKVQLRLDGRVRACCVLAGVHWPASDAFRLKRELNENISKGDFGPCKGCVYLRETTEKPNDMPVMIDILTNSFCSVRCWYCTYTRVGGMGDTPPEFQQDKCGVSQHVNNTEDIPTFIRDFSRHSNGTLHSISLSGGDSAFHPQFQEIVRTANEVGALLIYLSAGILPPATETFCIEQIRAGRMFLSISPDAMRAETWEKIKLRPAKLWPQLVSFVSRAAQANPGKVIVKRILMDENYSESAEFIRFWHAQGVRQFALSALFGNVEKQLPREQCEAAVAETKAAVAELEQQHGQKLHLETIAF